ncbi:MAG: molybdopterin-dependent oxidoreductase [Spirochaetes bacterium]|nr:molybdopterin-dependent oxidoreductase [Spirochaetota bacterium]
MSTVIDRYTELLLNKEFSDPMHLSSFEWAKVDAGAPYEKKTLYGLCRHCMQGDCVTLVHMEDGVVTGVEGRKDIPPNYGNLCPRGNSAIMSLYNPYRVKTPLVRTNPEKGLDIDPRWKEVTWDEALDITARELKKVKDEDPRGLVICEGWGERDTILRVPFIEAFGSPNEIGSHGPLCTVHYATGLIHGNFPVSVVDLDYCDYHITIGRSLGPNFATTGGTRKFVKALERGMKLICLDPRCSYEAAKGEWIPVRPGTDYAFLLAMTHIMMFEIQVYDMEFLLKRTNSAYLIGKDGNYLRDAKTNKPLVWDEKSNSAVPFNTLDISPVLEGTFNVNGENVNTGFTEVKQGFVKYTPEWAETICTIPAKTTRRIASEFVSHARIGSTIDIDGFTFPFRPVSLNTERNLTNKTGGTYADLTGKLINMMVGAIEVPGGCVGCGYRGAAAIEPTEDGTMKPGYEAVPREFNYPPQHIGLVEFFPNCHTTPHLAVNAILEPEKYYIDYEIKTWFSIGGNPIRMNGQPEKYVEAFKKIPFSVSIAYHMDEPASLADVLLPEHSYLERVRVAPFYPQHQSVSDEVAGLQMIQMRQPVPTLFNTKHVDDILLELADRIGILYGEGGLNDCVNKGEDWIIKEQGLNIVEPHKLDLKTRYPLTEIFDRQIKGWIFGDGTGFKELNEVGYKIHWQSKKHFYLYYYYPGDQTKHEFYFQHLKNTGDNLKANLRKHGIKFPGVDNEDYIFDMYKPVPHWIETNEPAEYDLLSFNWKTPYFSSDVGGAAGNPWLAELYKTDPYEAVICINPETAKKKNLKEGDRAVVSSQCGSLEGIVRVSELFHPDSIGISGGYGGGTRQGNPLNRKGPNFNALISTEINTLDPVSAGQNISPRVMIKKAKGRR